ncbi:hypothetical protein S40288_11772 [Stachybotrys chartarum IBT 40288]|nr:hypothetical protein S40288_11772 [Stachybotrys chartarum IBT 40288]
MPNMHNEQCYGMDTPSLSTQACPKHFRTILLLDKSINGENAGYLLAVLKDENTAITILNANGVQEDISEELIAQWKDFQMNAPLYSEDDNDPSLQATDIEIDVADALSKTIISFEGHFQEQLLVVLIQNTDTATKSLEKIGELLERNQLVKLGIITGMDFVHTPLPDNLKRSSVTRAMADLSEAGSLDFALLYILENTGFVELVTDFQVPVGIEVIQ